MADKSARVGARAIDAVLALALLVVVLLLVGDGARPWASLALGWLVVWGYEVVCVATTGTTLGKRASGIRVVSLDRVGPPELPTAARRAAVDASLTALPIIGWGIWAATSLGDPLGRGLADRAADTMVVPVGALLPVSTHDLPGYADGVRVPRLTPRGRVGEVDVRGRARLRRLDDSSALAAVVGLLALSVSLPYLSDALALRSFAIHLTLDDEQRVVPGVVVLSTIVWVIAFVLSETRLIRQVGATPGHDLAGLVVVDTTTGAHLTTGRSAARAIVLGLTLYVPVLWPLLIVSVAMMRWSSTGRGLHDLAGRSVVVGDPTLDPESQRQRAMRMRLGTAG